MSKPRAIFNNKVEINMKVLPKKKCPQSNGDQQSSCTKKWSLAAAKPNTFPFKPVLFLLTHQSTRPQIQINTQKMQQKSNVPPPS